MEKLILEIVVVALSICVIVLIFLLFNKKYKKYGIFDTIDSLKKQGYSDEKILLFTSYLCNLYATLAPDRIKETCRKVKSLDPEILMDIQKFNQKMEIEN